MRCLAIRGRIAIVTAGEKNPVQAVDNRSGVFRLRRDDDRHGAGAPQRFCVCRIDKGSVALTFFMRDIRADADDWFYAHQSTLLQV